MHSEDSRRPGMKTILLYLISVGVCLAIKCGVSKVELPLGMHMYNSNIAKKGAFPWMVNLERKEHISQKKYDQLCGGAIIENDWIITAAHCFEYTDLDLYRVSLGQHDRDNDNEEGNQFYKIKHLEMHSKFWADETDDIALLKLDRKIEYNDWVQPICLPRLRENLKWIDKILTDPREKLDCYVAGWGRTEHNRPSRRLRYTDMPLLPQKVCATQYEEGLYDSKTSLCAKDKEDDLQDACKGDSGGPIFCRRWNKTRFDRWRMYGLVSWGEKCGNANNPPGVYTNVMAYREWIKEKTRSYDQSVKTSL